MKRFALIVASATALVGATLPAAASAQAWQSINQRQANLDRRIDQGVRGGALTRQEASRLRAEFVALNRLEQQYRRSGGALTRSERADLDRRFDGLSARIRLERNDRQDRRR